MDERKTQETRPGEEPQEQSGRRTRARLAVAAAALLVVAVVVVGVIAARDTGPAQAVKRSSSPAVSVSGVDPITGKAVDLASYAGKPVVLNVWGSWCEGCRAEAADLQRFVERHPEVQMIGIDLQDTKSGARDFYREWGWSHPTVFDPNGEISFALGLQGTPTTYFLDEEHRLVTQIVGETDLAGFEEGLRIALSGS